MPAYSELDLEFDGGTFEIRTHSVVRQDANKPSYSWPKLKIYGDVDFGSMLSEWYEIVGGEANGSLAELVQNGLNHAISVAKDPSRTSADPTIKEFKASFRTAVSNGNGGVLADLKAQNEDLYEELKAAHIAKIQAQSGALA